MGRLEDEFRAKRAAGRKLLVPYITGGYPGWQAAIRAAAANGADAVEIGIPFSDPVMDGPVIQQASQAALEGGATPAAILDEVPGLDVEIPLVVMTYYNLVHHPGPTRFASDLRGPGSAGRSCPTCRSKSPGRGAKRPTPRASRRSCSPRRPRPTSVCPRVAARARGFIYSVGLLGVTGERASLAETATDLAARLKAITDVPVLVGVGVSDAAQAYQATRVADGVIQGASVVRRLMESGPDAVGDYVAEVRAAIDAP